MLTIRHEHRLDEQAQAVADRMLEVVRDNVAELEEGHQHIAAHLRSLELTLALVAFGFALMLYGLMRTGGNHASRL